MDDYYVEVVSYETGEVVKRMGPMSENKADKVESGFDRNLNHEKFYTRVIEDKPKKKAKRA
jgi:hypothetical protein